MIRRIWDGWKSRNSWMIGVEWLPLDETPTPQHPGPRLHPPPASSPSPASLGQSSQCDSSAFERLLLLFLFPVPLQVSTVLYSTVRHQLLRMLGWHGTGGTWSPAATMQGSVGLLPCMALFGLPTTTPYHSTQALYMSCMLLEIHPLAPK